VRLVVLALAALLLLAACEAEPADGPAPTATDMPPATETAAGPSPRLAASPLPSGLTEALVVGVVDGDTIDVLIDGREYRVRYIGIDTPETVDPNRPEGCFGKEASARNRELVDGETVGLEKDVSESDRYGRLLRYVWLPSTGSGRALMVNAVLVEEGYATASTYPPDVAHAEEFAALQASAREAGRGLWGPACASPQPSPAAAGACEYSNSDEAVIKGNISYTTGEKIYHVPGGYYYADTVVNESAGERWFCREADAVAAGWRKSKR
jgi:endonuclease YncB( thermonuclease family)